MRNKKIFVGLMLCLFMLGTTKNGSAQPFYTFQSITKHTLYFSFAWENKIVVGVGYGLRTASTKFTELTFEYRAPINDFYNGNNFEVIVGTHSRFVARRPLIAAGVHVKFQKLTTEEREGMTLGLAANVLPGYQVAASLSDGPSAVLGVRATYENTFFAIAHDKGSKEHKEINTFVSHNILLGPHFDVMIKRSLGLSFQPMVSNNWLKEEVTDLIRSEDWEMQGALYFGPSYRLNRR